MAGQAIRPSQFIFTYGVGSILEAPGGPRIIKDFVDWGRIFGAGRSPSVSDFKIPDSISSALLDNGLVFRIPTNVELNEPDAEVVFSTGYFPNWALCVKHGYLYELLHGDRTRCPECLDNGISHSGRPEAIRFVRACRHGHMDDIDWYGIVHSFKKDCNRNVYSWRSDGGSLRNVVIVCECGAQATLSDVYNRTSHCTGRFPEKGTTYSSCQEKAQVTLRGSSSLRIPEIITTITLPRFASKLHRIFDDIQMRTVVAMRDDWTKSELIKALENMIKSDPTLLDPRVIDEINSSDEVRLAEVIRDVKEFGTQRPTNIEDVRREEFRALQEAATLGHPPDPSSENPEFQVNKRRVRENVVLGKHKLRITPIERLRVVVVQKGYRRLGTDMRENKLVQTYYFDGKRKWFPGMEQIGEGIFIDMGKNPLLIDSKEWHDQFIANNRLVEYSPTFVWWHTLSHRIINALSIDSGYSSAAIRETVYTVPDAKTGELRGGILLYTAQSGGDGTLGGLISLVPQFDSVLENAMRNIDFCSNDPLCSEETIVNGRHSGASCYACLLLSETSCAHRNMYLDRNLLRGNFQ